MILKGTLGKIYRFLVGSIRKKSAIHLNRIPESCLHFFPSPDSKTPPRYTAVLYSGDGGWANLTTYVANGLRKKGIGVVGIDSMDYFRRERSPEEAAAGLEHLLDEVAEQWGETTLLLMGYSMGADVLPPIVNHLHDRIKGRIVHVILMSPSIRGLLRFRIVGWFGFHTPDHLGYPLLPEVEKLAPLPVYCIAGEKEEKTLARLVPAELAKSKFLHGGHHYGGHYHNLVDEILAVLPEES